MPARAEPVACRKPSLAAADHQGVDSRGAWFVSMQSNMRGAAAPPSLRENPAPLTPAGVGDFP